MHHTIHDDDGDDDFGDHGDDRVGDDDDFGEWFFAHIKNHHKTIWTLLRLLSYIDEIEEKLSCLKNPMQHEKSEHLVVAGVSN